MKLFNSLLVLIVAVLVAYVYSTTFTFQINHSVSVFFFHGVTGNATNGRNIKANLTAEADWRGKVQRDLSALAADQQLQTKFSLMNMVRPPVKNYFVENNQYLPMTEAVEYQQDTYGLRSLDERGALHRTIVPGVSHILYWLADGMWLDAPDKVCEWFPLWDEFVYPALQ
ncbi:hypothetical protein PHMEG_0002134 [Phytophthora megakarya]|uniref:Uncharacterized protein n=1 Tax=Phytophthora megakarya TaxID=4795 RepID=A0A225X050_9STRA|nr:hypothetical protein PHMEG_0002134 [Phytophthora megakarya]